MSSNGQIIGTVVGAVVGWLVPGSYVALGASIGGAIGAAIDPPKIPKGYGPRLSDLSMQTAAYGQPIPRVYGTITVAGNVFWIENNALKETVTVTKTASGGKGGKKKSKTVTYSYSVTMAVGLCKVDPSKLAIKGIRRLWVGPDLYYDAGSDDVPTIIASNQAATGFTFYPGSDSQDPDPRMQATLGVESTPAWRGLAYLVFEDLSLGRYGNSLAGAQIKAELIADGYIIDYPYVSSTVSNAVYQRPAWDGTVFCSVKRDSHVAIVSSDGVEWAEYAINGSGPTNYQGVASNGAGVLLIYGAVSAGIFRSTDHGASWTPITLPGTGVGTITQVVYGDGKFVAIGENGLGLASWYASADDGVTWQEQLHGLGYAWNPLQTLCWHSASAKWYVLVNGGPSAKGIYASPTGLGPSWSLVHARGADYWANADLCCVHRGRILYNLDTAIGASTLWSDDGVTWAVASAPNRYLSFFSDDEHVWIAGGYYANTAKAYYSSTGIGDWTLWTGPYPVPYAVGGYGNTLLVFLPYGGTAGYIVAKSFAGSVDAVLGDVVKAECLQSNALSEADIDVGSLTQPVRGYRIAGFESIRSAVEPLLKAFSVDLVQRGYKLVGIPRGGSAVATIAAAELDARSENQSPGVQIFTSRDVEGELPRRVFVRYFDVGREYDQGMQYAERLVAETVNDVVLDLPIVFTDREAAERAEVILYRAWLDRLTYRFSVPSSYAALEVADVVNLETPEGTVIVRLVSIEYTSDGRLECAGKLEASAVYSASALGAASAVSGVALLTANGASVYQLLDIPRLNSTQDATGFPVAMCGTSDGWPGGVLMQSVDGGSSYGQVTDFARPGSVIGVAGSTLGVVDSRMIDRGSSLTVILKQGELFSISEDLMLSGGNLFAYGQDGRWEIISAQTCTLQSGKTYVLRNLVRGRYGTDWAMGLHGANDWLVGLDVGWLQFLSLETSAIGKNYFYRAITDGRELSSDADRSMAYKAVNLKPLAPLDVNGNRDPVTLDWNLLWTPRTRIASDWLDGVDFDPGESSLSFEVDFFSDATFSSVKRTTKVTATNCQYLSADQMTDFGSNQSTLHLGICQMSSIIGRGYPLLVTISR